MDGIYSLEEALILYFFSLNKWLDFSMQFIRVKLTININSTIIKNCLQIHCIHNKNYAILNSGNISRI